MSEDEAPSHTMDQGKGMRCKERHSPLHLLYPSCMLRGLLLGGAFRGCQLRQLSLQRLLLCLHALQLSSKLLRRPVSETIR